MPLKTYPLPQQLFAQPLQKGLRFLCGFLSSGSRSFSSPKVPVAAIASPSVQNSTAMSPYKAHIGFLK